MPKRQSPILMAVIGAPHGIKGEVRVKSFTQDPLSLGDFGPLATADGRSFEIASIRPQGTVLVARFKGVDDRNAAEALTGTELFVERSALPPETEEDEFYHADLIGLAVIAGTERLGEVTSVQNFGGGDILELALGEERGVLIPFTAAAVPEVDLARGFVRIEPVAAGLDVGEGRGSSSRQSEEPGGSQNAGARRPRGPKDAGGNR